MRYTRTTRTFKGFYFGRPKKKELGYLNFWISYQKDYATCNRRRFEIVCLKFIRLPEYNMILSKDYYKGILWSIPFRHPLTVLKELLEDFDY